MLSCYQRHFADSDYGHRKTRGAESRNVHHKQHAGNRQIILVLQLYITYFNFPFSNSSFTNVHHKQCMNMPCCSKRSGNPSPCALWVFGNSETSLLTRNYIICLLSSGLLQCSDGGDGIWEEGDPVSDSMPVSYPSTQALHHQHIVPNLGASVGSQSPIKQPDHSDKVTDLMLGDIIKLSI